PRDGRVARHPLRQLLRAPSAALHRRGPRRLHPQRPGHRPEQAGAPGRVPRAPAADPGAHDQPDRRFADRPAAAGWRGRGDRGDAHLYDRPGRPEAGRDDGDLGGARRLPAPGRDARGVLRRDWASDPMTLPATRWGDYELVWGAKTYV